MYEKVQGQHCLPQSLCTLCSEAGSLTEPKAQIFTYTCCPVSLSHLSSASIPKPGLTDICIWSQLFYALQQYELGSSCSHSKCLQLSHFSSSRYFGHYHVMIVSAHKCRIPSLWLTCIALWTTAPQVWSSLEMDYLLLACDELSFSHQNTKQRCKQACRLGQLTICS